ncbi:Imm21 family immunity protein [Streptomyces virginiae]|uniref:Imm21 family immunity protein n=1 Tax=Streptomyces virginiae TaxID=1961 RepID=UPI00365FFA6C
MAGCTGLLTVGPSRALVLGDEPSSTTFLPEHGVFVRWVAAESETEPDNHTRVELTPGRCAVRAASARPNAETARPPDRLPAGQAAPDAVAPPGHPFRGLTCRPWNWMPNSALWQLRRIFRPMCCAACSSTRGLAVRRRCCAGT